MRGGLPDWRDVLLEKQPSAFVVVDRGSGVVLRVADLFADQVGLAGGEVVGGALDVVVREAGFSDRLRGTPPDRVVLPPSAMKDGAAVEASVHEVHFDGKPALLLVVDLAERTRRLQQVLDELAEFPRTNPGPVLRLSRGGRVELANAAAGRLFGRDDLSGAYWPDLCAGVTAGLWAEVLEAQGHVTHEATVGDRRMSFAHVFRPGREVVFVYGSDVTMLRRQEEQLAEQARFPDMNPGPVLRLDLDGRVLLSNVAARELLPEVVVGSSWVGKVPGVDSAFWSKVLAAEVPVAMDTTIRGRDFQFTHRLDPRRNVFVYGADVTGQKAAERAVRDSERLATLGTLAAGVAHELNNPAAAARRASAHLAEALTRMRRSAEMLGSLALSPQARASIIELEQAAQSGTRGASGLTSVERADREEEVDEWMATHGHAGAGSDVAQQWVHLGLGSEDLMRLSTSVGDSLPVAVERIAAVADVVALVDQVGRSTERVSEIALALKRYTYLGQAEVLGVDIHQGLEDTLLLLGHKLTAGPKVTRDYADGVLTVWGIGSELNQVWMNLIDNAIDAAGPGGRLVLRTRSASTSHGMRVDVQVEDDGPGIPDEVRSRVFEPFFTTKAPGSGTGLGLATSWSIVVDRHHGSLAVESQPRRTVFTVTLPVTGPESNERSVP
jgi:signal transduction histidine kinase